MVPDDRPADSISFAASNLVKPDLRSRTRQQSEPPLHRQVFPPTPPPESDKLSPFRRSNELDRPFSFNRSGTATGSEMDKSLGGRSSEIGGGNESDKTQSATDSAGSSGREAEKPALAIRTKEVDRPAPLFRNHTDTARASSTMTDRAASVRNKAKPARLENLRPPGPAFGEESISAVRERPRLGTIRTASEPRGPVSRSYSRSNDPGPDYGRPRLNLAVGDRAHHHRRLDVPDEEAEDEYSGGDFYDMYQRSRGSTSTKSKRSSASRRNTSRSRLPASEYIEEEQQQERGHDEQPQQNHVTNNGPRRASASGTLTTGPMSSEADGDSFVDENDFEMLSAGGVVSARPTTARPSNARRTSRRPEIRKVRL